MNLEALADGQCEESRSWASARSNDSWAYPYVTWLARNQLVGHQAAAYEVASACDCPSETAHCPLSAYSSAFDFVAAVVGQA